jgi:hypothetical protein
MTKRYQRGNQNPYIEEEQTTQVIVLSVLLQYTDSDYPFGIFWPLRCLFFFNIRILITPLVSVGHCVVWYWRRTDNTMTKRYQRGNQNPYIEEEQTTQWSKDTKGVIRIWFWLPLWYLLAIVLSVLLQYTDSDYPFGICWPLCCLSFFNIQILIKNRQHNGQEIPKG